MLRASHVAGVSRQDCRALFANLSDVEHQLEPCDDGRRAAVRLKRDSNTVPKCPAAAGRGEHQASRGPWVVGGDVGDGGRAGWRTRGRCVAWGRVRVGPPAGAHRVGGQALCGSGAWRAPLLTRAFSFHRPLREQGRAWTVEEGRQNTRGAWMAAAEEARGVGRWSAPRRRPLASVRRGTRASGEERLVRTSSRILLRLSRLTGAVPAANRVGLRLPGLGSG